VREELLIQRAGNFTASGNHALMSSWDTPEPDRNFEGYSDLYPVIKAVRAKGASKAPNVADIKPIYPNVTGKMKDAVWKAVMFDETPKGLITYAEEKACETLFNVDPSLQWSTVHTRNGKDREAMCMFLAGKALKKSFYHTGENQIHEARDEVGMTPDGLAYHSDDVTIDTGGEAKCKSPLVHARNLMICSNADMKELAFDAYVQVQTSMLVGKCSKWAFANYNPFAKKESHIHKSIWIERDESFIAILQKRVDIAKSIKHKFLADFYQKNGE